MRKHKAKLKKIIYCNPDVCPYCMYIGEGDSVCDIIHEIVLVDWVPTEHYMGVGCPFSGKDCARCNTTSPGNSSENVLQLKKE